MTHDSDLIHVFAGTELTVLHLKDILGDSGITCLIRNDYESGKSAGFMGGTPTTVDLYIQKSDEAKAETIMAEFVKALEGK